MLADKSKCHECGIVIFIDPASDYCPKCNKSTEWTILKADVEVAEVLERSKLHGIQH